MGVLIGFHGAPLINSLIGVVWFIFAITACSVTFTALTSKKQSSSKTNLAQLDSWRKELKKERRAGKERRRPVKARDFKTNEAIEPA